MGKARHLTAALDDASLSRFHLRAVLVSGAGFFTDAYDLFIIGVTAALVQQQWHLGTASLAVLTSVTLAGSVLGALVFGRSADLAGRTRAYWLVAGVLIAGAVASALAPSFWVLVAARFVLGIGIGGDYPVSAVLMSEYANARDRGKLVGMVFAAQALGLIVGPAVALGLLGSGMSHAAAWRVLLGLGAVPAALVLWWRRRMPESPRYAEQVQGTGPETAVRLAAFTRGKIGPDALEYPWKHRMGLRLFWSFLKYRYVLIGTAGAWFLFDYAYYGNTISAPRILAMVAPHASLTTITALQLVIFAVAALPGYLLAIFTMDRIGHRRLQWAGFAMMAVCFALAGIIPGVTTMLAPFLILFGVSYFFSEFGPNTTLFVLPAELFPVSVRATGHGISSAVAKLGAFTGVFAFGFLQASLGLRGSLILSAAVAVGGALLTLLLEEPAGRSLEDVCADDDVTGFADPAVLDSDAPSAALGTGAGALELPAHSGFSRYTAGLVRQVRGQGPPAGAVAQGRQQRDSAHSLDLQAGHPVQRRPREHQAHDPRRGLPPGTGHELVDPGDHEPDGGQAHHEGGHQLGEGGDGRGNQHRRAREEQDRPERVARRPGRGGQRDRPDAGPGRGEHAHSRGGHRVPSEKPEHARDQLEQRGEDEHDEPGVHGVGMTDPAQFRPGHGNTGGREPGEAEGEAVGDRPQHDPGRADLIVRVVRVVRVVHVVRGDRVGLHVSP